MRIESWALTPNGSNRSSNCATGATIVPLAHLPAGNCDLAKFDLLLNEIYSREEAYRVRHSN